MFHLCMFVKHLHKWTNIPYDKVNRSVFSLRLNSAVVRHNFNSVGSGFHTRKAATENAHSPILSLGLQTAKSPWVDTSIADQAGFLQPVSVDEQRTYLGAWLTTALWASWQSLYLILVVTGSQCNSQKVVVTWSRIKYSSCCRVENSLQWRQGCHWQWKTSKYCVAVLKSWKHQCWN